MIFEDTAESPRGRARIDVHPALLAAIADSAATGTSKMVRLTSPELESEVRRQLASAAVRDHYKIITRTRRNPHRLIIRALPAA